MAWRYEGSGVCLTSLLMVGREVYCSWVTFPVSVTATVLVGLNHSEVISCHFCG